MLTCCSLFPKIEKKYQVYSRYISWTIEGFQAKILIDLQLVENSITILCNVNFSQDRDKNYPQDILDSGRLKPATIKSQEMLNCGKEATRAKRRESNNALKRSLTIAQAPIRQRSTLDESRRNVNQARIKR